MTNLAPCEPLVDALALMLLRLARPDLKRIQMADFLTECQADYRGRARKMLRLAKAAGVTIAMREPSP